MSWKTYCEANSYLNEGLIRTEPPPERPCWSCAYRTSCALSLVAGE